MTPGLQQPSAPVPLQGVSHYENFPVASLLCPPRLRPPIAAIYWFARTADDIADEGEATPQARLDELAAYRADLMATAAGLPPSSRWAPVFEQLKPQLARFELPVNLLADLLSAFEQDAVKQRYADEAELLDYCKRSANPVGRLLLHLYGLHDDASLRMSDDICTALQLINFWQDLGVDIPRGRIYLPADAWARHGVDEAQLLALQPNANTLGLIAEHVHAARAMMIRGTPLCKKIPGRGGWELRLVVQGGLRVLDKIEMQGFNTLQRRPKLNPWDLVVMGWRALFMR